MSDAGVRIETDLVCSECGYREWLSPEDPDATLSEMERHIRRQHSERDTYELLRDVYEVNHAPHS